MICWKPFFISLLVLVVFSSCGIFENEQEPVSPVPGKIVVSIPQSEEGSSQIYVMKPNGTGLKKLTNFGNDVAAQPSWSPDGTQIVFTTGFMGTTGGPAIFIMNADGSNQRPMKVFPEYPSLAYPGSNPKWSPDGTKIAYSQCLGCEAGGSNSEIFVYDFETDSVLRITDHPADDHSPTWSPDGTQIAFASNREHIHTENTLQYDICIYNFGENSLDKVTTDGKVGNWIYYPDNKNLLIRTRYRPFTWYSIDTVSKDTLSQVNISSELNTSMLIPITWTSNRKYLMLLNLDFPVFDFSFYDFTTSEVIPGVEINDLSGFDWYYDEDEQ